MGTGNIDDPGAGSIIQLNDILQLNSAFKGDVVPRNSTGVATTGAGSLGTNILEWNAVYAAKYFQNGEEVNLGGSGGGGNPGTIAASTSIRNGVVSGLEPASRPGMANWIHQAGTNGVVITASTGDPFVVKLDGVTYTRTSNIGGGGPLPSDVNIAINPLGQVRGGDGYSLAGGGDPSQGGDQYVPWQSDRAAYRYCRGGVFNFDNPSGTELIPDSYGNNVIVRSTGTSESNPTYTYFQKISNSTTPSGERNRAKLKMGGCFNTATAGSQEYHRWRLPWCTQHGVIRCAGVFVNPLVSDWDLTYSPRIVGAVDIDLPPTTGYATGDFVFRESTSRWHRFSGTAWTETSYVFCAFIGIRNGAVECVLPVRTEESLARMYDKKLAVLGDAISRSGVLDGDLVRYGGDTNSVEEKGFVSLGSQQFSQVGTSAVVDTSSASAGTLANDTLFCTYLDVRDNTYHFEETPPVYQLYRGRLLLMHPSRQRLYVGSFAVDGSGNVIAAPSMHDRTDVPRNRIAEGDDDRFIVWNQSLYMQVRRQDTKYPNGRRMNVRIRGVGSNPNNAETTQRYRWTGSRQYWKQEEIKNKEDWNRVFATWLSSSVLQELEFDTDQNDYWEFEFTEWDEQSLLHALGLTEAGREGRFVAAGGVSGAGVASLDAGAYAEGSVGTDAYAPASIDWSKLITQDAIADQKFLKAVQNPDDLSQYSLTWADATLADQSVTYDSINPSFLAREVDLLAPNENAPRMVLDTILHDTIKGIRDSLGIFYTEWSTVTTANKTGDLSANDSMEIGGYTFNGFGSSATNIKTVTLSDTSPPALVDDDVSGLPDFSSLTNFGDPGGPVFRGGVLFLSGDGDRVLIPTFNPEIPETPSSPAIEAYRLNAQSEWEPMAFDDPKFLPAYDDLPSDGKWYICSEKAHDRPTANALRIGPNMASRAGNLIRAVDFGYDTTDNVFEFAMQTRMFEIPVDLDEDILLASTSTGVTPSENTNRNLNTGYSFADYDQVYFQVGTNSASASTLSPIFKPSRSTTGISMAWESNGVQYQIFRESNTSYRFLSSNSSHRLFRILGLRLV